jgi:hypothetical protein
MSEDGSLEGNTNINNKKPTSICRHRHMKEVEEKDDLFSFFYPLLFYFLPQFDYNHNNQEKMDMISRILHALQFNYSRSLLILILVHQPDGKKATKTRAMTAITTLDMINMYHHIQTRRIHTQSSGILSHLCSLTLWIT